MSVSTELERPESAPAHPSSDLAEGDFDGSPSSGADEGSEFVNVPRGRRPGRQRPFRPTQGEMQQRVNDAIDLILQGERLPDVSVAIAEKYGLAPRSSERYVQLARQELIAQSEKPREEWRAINIACYLRIANESGVRALDRIKALERVDKLLGLEIHLPRQVQLTGADGGPVQMQSAVVVCGVDLSGKLGEVGAQIRKAALATLIETIQADPKTLAAMPVVGGTVENVPETVDASRLPVES